MSVTKTIDARDTFCPGPLMELISYMKHASVGDVVELLDGIDMKIDVRLQQAGLVPIQLVGSHLAERDIEQSGLIHVAIGRRKHGDSHLARTSLGAQTTRQIVGDDGAGSAATND